MAGFLNICTHPLLFPQPLAYRHDLIRRLPAAPIGQLEQFLPDRWSASTPQI